MSPYPYQDKAMPTEKRLADLLKRMNLEEKVGQMMQLPANRPGMMDLLETMHVGSYLHCTGEIMVDLQKRAEKSRLGIPLIFGIDAIHGHCFENGATVFPTQLALSSSWDTAMFEDMARITAREVRACGLHWTFSPVLCVGRDTRWGRIDETFGEDPWLIGEFAAAMVKGYQGDDLSTGDSILACAKHYAGYAESLGGRDAYESMVSRREMLSLFLPPFEKAVRQAGCATLMAGYQATDGVPCSADPWLLKVVPKEDWGMDGFVVTDWANVDSLHDTQFVAENSKEAAYQAILAGNDMIMSSASFYDNAVELVREGRIEESLVEESAARILRQKFRLGLFDERRHTDPGRKSIILGSEPHWRASLDASRESLVLLKNDGVLPLASTEGLSLLLTGANADDVVAQLGDWSFGSMQAGATDDTFHRKETVTLKQGLESRCRKAGMDFRYIPGAGPASDLDELATVGDAAKQSDIVVVCVGDTLSEHGEFKDRSSLALTGNQTTLLETVRASGTPFVVVFIASKPLELAWVKEHAGALVCAFNPGAKGGVAIAECLFGDFNPSGKLTISFPYHAGQLPVYYNRYAGWHAARNRALKGRERYIDLPAEPVYAFGQGIGFAPVTYLGLELERDSLRSGESLLARVLIRNDGNRDATEIVQLYVNDVVSSVTTPAKSLRAYARIDIAPGEEKSVALIVPFEELSLVNRDLDRVVESGEFECMVGPSSLDDDLLRQRFTVRREAT